MSYAEELGSEVRNLEKSIIVKTNLEIEKKESIPGRIYAGIGRHVSGSSIGT